MQDRHAGVLPDRLINVLAILIVAMFLLPLAAGFVGQLAASAVGIEVAAGQGRVVWTLGVVVVQDLALLALTLVHVLGRQGLGLSPRFLGLRPVDWSAEVRSGLGWGLLLIGLNAIGYGISRGAFRLLLSPERFEGQVEREQAVLIEFFRMDQPVWLLAALTAVAVLLAPVAEELFFRGYAHAVFRYHLGRRALWASAALFGLVHGYVIHFLPLFLVGIGLAWLYERRGSLMAPLVAHATVNAVVAAYLLFSPGWPPA